MLPLIITSSPFPPLLYRQDYLQLPIKILPSLHSTVSEACVSSLTHLPQILLEEEQESYATCQRFDRHYIIITSQTMTSLLCHKVDAIFLRFCEDDLLTRIHNGAGISLCCPLFSVFPCFPFSLPFPSESIAFRKIFMHVFLSFLIKPAYSVQPSLPPSLIPSSLPPSLCSSLSLPPSLPHPHPLSLTPSLSLSLTPSLLPSLPPSLQSTPSD